MITAIILLKVKDDDDIETVRDLLAQQRRMSLRESGCTRFEVYHSTAVPAQFVLCEWWADRESLEAHRLGKAFTELYQPKVIPLVDRQPHPCELVE